MGNLCHCSVQRLHTVIFIWQLYAFSVLEVNVLDILKNITYSFSWLKSQLIWSLGCIHGLIDGFSKPVFCIHILFSSALNESVPCRCVELVINEQMSKYKARLKDISSLEFAESKAKSRLTHIRKSMVRSDPCQSSELFTLRPSDILVTMKVLVREILIA